MSRPVSINKIRIPKITMRKFKSLSEKDLAIRKREFEAGTVPSIILHGRTVIDGVQRLGTAKQLGYDTINAIQVKFIDLTDQVEDQKYLGEGI